MFAGVCMLFIFRPSGVKKLPKPGEVIAKVTGRRGRGLLHDGDNVGVLELLSDEISSLNRKIISSAGQKEKTAMLERLGDIYYTCYSLSSGRRSDFLQRALNEYGSAGCLEKVELIKKKISELNEGNAENKQ